MLMNENWLLASISEGSLLQIPTLPPSEASVGRVGEGASKGGKNAKHRILF